MKKQGLLKKLSIFVLLFSMAFSYVLPVAAATDDDSQAVETSEDEDIEETEEESTDDEEVLEAIDVDLSNIELGQQFKDYEGITYTVDDLSSTIYVGSGDNQATYSSDELPNFQITYTNDDGVTTWRKYVKLEDLCNVTKKDGTHICEIMDSTDMNKGKFFLRRLYKDKIYQSVYDEDYNFDMQEISLYYRSYHNVGEKRFEAILKLVEGTDDSKLIDTYLFNQDENIDYQGTWSQEKDKNGNQVSVLTTDVETLKDKNGEVYVSLRFVSESLGAEVTWVPEKESRVGNDDEVIIQFYDDKEYCKDIHYTFTNDNGDEITPENMEKSLYLKETVMKNISLDGNYTYTNQDGKEFSADVDWKKLYLLLKPADNYPENFFTDENGNDINLPLHERVIWGDDSNGDKVLWVRGYVYGKFSDGQCQIGDVSYDCNLGEAVDATGIILYKGVPVPIDLFNINKEYCSSNNRNNNLDEEESDTEVEEFDEENSEE